MEDTREEALFRIEEYRYQFGWICGLRRVKKHYTTERENQESILLQMERLVNRIRIDRIITGEESIKHGENWKEIDVLYKKLNCEHQEQFNEYVF